MCTYMHVCIYICVCVSSADCYINMRQCSVSLEVISQRVWTQVRIWACGCLAHTTRMASGDISFIPQAQSCSLLLDKSSSISLKPFYHTTHIKGLYEKMICVLFFSRPYSDGRVMGIITPPWVPTSHLSWSERKPLLFVSLTLFLFASHLSSFKVFIHLQLMKFQFNILFFLSVIKLIVSAIFK